MSERARLAGPFPSAAAAAEYVMECKRLAEALRPAVTCVLVGRVAFESSKGRKVYERCWEPLSAVRNDPSVVIIHERK